MRRSIRAIILNSDDTFSATLRAQLLSVEGMHVVAEVEDAAMLGTAVNQFPCDVLIAHLDPDPHSNLVFLTQVASEKPGLPIFAISESSDGQLILNAMRIGIREYLTKPLDPAQLDTALGRVAQQAADKAEPGAILTVMNSVGGVGSSTVAVNLAVELAIICQAEQKKVVLVDLDYKFGQVATMLDLHPKFTIADLCESPEQLDPQLIGKAVMEHASGLHVLARPTHFAQAELITAANCVSVLTGLQDLYEYVVVDGPTRFDTGAKSVFDLAALQILVAQLTVPSVRNVHRILEAFTQNGFNLERVKLICNRVGKDSGLLEPEHVEATLGREIYFSLPDDWKTVSAAVNMGLALSQSAVKSRVRQAFIELAQKIHGASGNGHAADQNGELAVAGAKKSGTLFSKLFSG